MPAIHRLAKRDAQPHTVAIIAVVAAVLCILFAFAILARRDFRARTRTPPDAPSLTYPSAAPDPSLAHVPAAHLHRPVRPGYAQGQGPVYEDIVLEGAMRRRTTDLPAYDAEAKPPRYLDVVS